MADPSTDTATQLRNIETETGKRFVHWCRLITDSGLVKVGEQRTLLMNQLGLGYGDANALALPARQAAAPAAADAHATPRIADAAGEAVGMMTLCL